MRIRKADSPPPTAEKGMTPQCREAFPKEFHRLWRSTARKIGLRPAETLPCVPLSSDGWGGGTGIMPRGGHWRQSLFQSIVTVPWRHFSSGSECTDVVH